MADTGHSSWGASGFKQIMLCPGSKALQAGTPNKASAYSAEGTAAHQVLTWALNAGQPAAAYVGRRVHLNWAGRVIPQADKREPGGDYYAAHVIDVDDDMARFVQITMDYVRDVAGDDGVVLVDRKVCYAGYLDLPDEQAWGTLDVAVLRADGELVVIDLKYGRGVEVDAGTLRTGFEPVGAGTLRTEFEPGYPNPQLALYALGGLAEFAPMAEMLDMQPVERVRLVITQPRVSFKPSEYDMTVDELVAWGRTTARSAVNSARTAVQTHAVHCRPEASSHERQGWERTFLRPGEDQCRFCRAKATCPALRYEVLSTVLAHSPATADEFADTSVPGKEHIEPTTDEWLDAAYPKLGMIEGWAKAVLAEIERRALAGTQFKTCKLVEGRKGPRAWDDVASVEEYLKEKVRLKNEEMYTMKLKSPAQLEKLAPPLDKEGKVIPAADGSKPAIGPRQWKEVVSHIVRAAAGKHVAPITDERPALVITPAADEFEPVPQPSATADFSDLA
jgi:hypothetical protein